ncbi:MAG: hypothetical protein M1829_002101 [Trizodia sp. TS-e1964]|nr:MAG: hypothetical protein M1829_002101 [Trizodia sp. TS-e1964]
MQFISLASFLTISLASVAYATPVRLVAAGRPRVRLFKGYLGDEALPGQQTGIIFEVSNAPFTISGPPMKPNALVLQIYTLGRDDWALSRVRTDQIRLDPASGEWHDYTVTEEVGRLQPNAEILKDVQRHSLLGYLAIDQLSSYENAIKNTPFPSISLDQGSAQVQWNIAVKERLESDGVAIM